MKRTEREIDRLLEEVAGDIRAGQLADSVVESAAQRVWQRLASEQVALQTGVTPVEHLRGCEDFQSLIPSYLEGTLTAARTLLLEDHFSECVPCRRALKVARHGNETARQMAFQRVKIERRDSRLAALKWGIAAAAVLAVGLLSWPIWQRFNSSSGVLNGVVEAADGEVYRVTDNRTELLRSGEKVFAGEKLRTARGARAMVRLNDGSTVELGERGEFGFASQAEGVVMRQPSGSTVGH